MRLLILFTRRERQPTINKNCIFAITFCIEQNLRNFLLADDLRDVITTKEDAIYLAALSLADSIKSFIMALRHQL